MMHIKTPATTANMGPGFDCIGMALELYNHIWVEECDKPCLIECKNDTEGNVPRTTNNMIYQTMERFYDELGLGKMPGVHIVQEDHIPMTRGLGSSAACITGGLIAANALSAAKLSRDDLAFLASKIEGHPDNVAPAFFGGIIIGVLTKQKLEYIKIENDFLKNIHFAVMIPAFPLSTEKARNILPGSYSTRDAVFNASRTALMAAAFINGDFSKLSVAMDDRFHQPHRSKIIPNMDGIFTNANNIGAKGVFLSGAGPTIIAVTDNKDFTAQMKAYLDTLPQTWDVSFIKPDFTGAVIDC